MTDYRRKARITEAERFDPRQPLPSGVSEERIRRFWLNTQDGKRVKVLRGDWIVTFTDGSKEVMSNSKFSSLFEEDV